MTEQQAIELLRKAATPSLKALAVRLAISDSYLSDVLKGRRDPARVLARFGLKRIVSYVDTRRTA